MKILSLALVSVLGLGAVNAAHAHEHFSFRGWVNFGPRCEAPASFYCPPRPYYCPPPARVYCPPQSYDDCTPAVTYAPPSGYWRDESFNVWVPCRVVTRYDECGCAQTYEIPGHYETRTRRVWVSACN